MVKIFENTPYFKEEKGAEPFIETFLLDGENNPCIIVCPGGGYMSLAEHEYYNEFFNSLGFSCVVLHYRLTPYTYPCQQIDLARTIRYVKAHAQEFRINPEKILIAGSSAGGHLCASVAAANENDFVTQDDEIDKFSLKVNGVVLCYPLILTKDENTKWCFDNLLGEQKELIEKVSAEKLVNSDMPPVFLWHTFEDKTVDVRHSLEYAAALKQSGVPFELHIYPYGNHGWGLAEWEPYINAWTESLKKWLELNKFI